MVVLSAATPVFVMLPLDTVDGNGNVQRADQLKNWFSQLKNNGVTGVMGDVWWGLVEKSPKQYNWNGYIQLMQLIEGAGLKAEFVMSFHQCGGNVGDACNIPLPSWVLSVSDIFYKDRNGFENKEYVSLWADTLSVIGGRTPVQVYGDFMASFASTFADYFKRGSIVEIEVGMGPAGELRYPSYPLSKWSFCGVGEFQCYDKNALTDLANAASKAGHSEWGHGGPSNAGSYSDRLGSVAFYSGSGDNYKSPYGQFFLSWYSQSLIDHGDRLLGAARSAFSAFPSLRISGKISGVHWWYNSDAHPSELTAGYYNIAGRDGYQPIARMFAKYKATFDFTCLEMKNQEQPSECQCGPEQLVGQVKNAARSAGIDFSGENALPRFDQTAFDQIKRTSSDIAAFTYLRLGNDLMSGNNFNNFAQFVRSMNGNNAPTSSFRGAARLWI
eukprot:GILI01007003.1.p2 GENE.GILI01007003.1~~GILI01007003.1.p2  ORF type:complete len:498 (+),score=163.82 GILI01007003.1:171-1496(+)